MSILTDDLVAALPEGYADEPILKETKDIAGLAKLAVDLKRYQGQSLRIPTKEASQDAWDQFYAKVQEKGLNLAKLDLKDEQARNHLFKTLGVPQDPEGYNPDSDRFEAGDLFDQDRATDFAKFAHELKLTPPQFDGVMKRFFDWAKANNQAIQQQQNERTQALQSEWGQAYEAKFADAAAIANRFAGLDSTEALQILAQSDARLVKAMAEVAGAFREKGFGNLPPSRPQGTMTRDEAQAELDDIMGNKEHAYWDRTKPRTQRESAFARVLRLQRILDEG